MEEVGGMGWNGSKQVGIGGTDGGSPFFFPFFYYDSRCGTREEKLTRRKGG